MQKEWEMLESMDNFEVALSQTVTEFGSSRAHGNSVTSNEEDSSRMTSHDTPLDTPTSSASLASRLDGLAFRSCTILTVAGKKAVQLRIGHWKDTRSEI